MRSIDNHDARRRTSSVCDIDPQGVRTCLVAGLQRRCPRPPGTARHLCVRVFQAMGKRRLDTLLAERGLFPSRSRAAASVMAGEVFVTPGQARSPRGRAPRGQAWRTGRRADARSALGAPRVRLTRWREAGQRARGFGLDVEGRRALTSARRPAVSPTACSARGREVIAVDVAYGAVQLPLRIDPRVTVIERTNARTLRAQICRRYQPNLIVIDVSFISLTKVLPAVLACAARGSTAWRWSSRSSRSGATASARGGRA